MPQISFALYDAFTDSMFSGSPAAVVTDASSIDIPTRRKLAKEIGTPATAYVNKCSGDEVELQFFSTVMELPMCGHGTICVMTHLIEQGDIALDGKNKREIKLCLPNTTATVGLFQRVDEHIQVMLDIQPPKFSQGKLDVEKLTTLLGIVTSDLDGELPMETANGDFIHLVVPVKGLVSMGKIKPDFGGLTDFCNQIGIETVATFCRETEKPTSALHIRDFCPAVGVAESAAAGTTNAALTSYLIRHDIIKENHDGKIMIEAEQGHEIDRPSTIYSEVTLDKREISRLRVGGVATKVLEGQLNLS